MYRDELSLSLSLSLSFCSTPPPPSTMDARIEILPEKLLPHRPYELFTCPAHVYDGCHATQLLARQPDCSEEIIKRLEVCRRRLQVSHVTSVIRFRDQHMQSHIYAHTHTHTHTHAHTVSTSLLITMFHPILGIHFLRYCKFKINILYLCHEDFLKLSHRLFVAGLFTRNPNERATDEDFHPREGLLAA